MLHVPAFQCATWKAGSGPGDAATTVPHIWDKSDASMHLSSGSTWWRLMVVDFVLACLHRSDGISGLPLLGYS